MTPEELAALEAEQPVDCPKCGWQHRPSRPCIKTKWSPALAQKVAALGTGGSRLAAIKGDEAIERLRLLGERADEAKRKGENQPAPTGQTCPTCGDELLHYRNFLGYEWDGYPDPVEDFLSPEDHAKRCGIKPALAPEDVKPARRVIGQGDD